MFTGHILKEKFELLLKLSLKKEKIVKIVFDSAIKY